jgi:hypothetical protein
MGSTRTRRAWPRSVYRHRRSSTGRVSPAGSMSGNEPMPWHKPRISSEIQRGDHGIGDHGIIVASVCWNMALIAGGVQTMEIESRAPWGRGEPDDGVEGLAVVAMVLGAEVEPVAFVEQLDETLEGGPPGSAESARLAGPCWPGISPGRRLHKLPVEYPADSRASAEEDQAGAGPRAWTHGCEQTMPRFQRAHGHEGMERGGLVSS